MSRFNKTLLASASLAVLATAAQAQVQNQLFGPAILPYLPQNGVIQRVDASWVRPDFSAEARLMPFVADPSISLTNLAGATAGVKDATSQVFQIGVATFNQFGSGGSAVRVLGDYSVTQLYEFGNNNNIAILNSNGSFSPTGKSATGGSQVAATVINNMAVDNGKGGRTFDITQVYAPDEFGFGRDAITGKQTITQQNSMTAGYNTNSPVRVALAVPGPGPQLVGTGEASIHGDPLEGSSSTMGVQANSVTINTASVNLLNPDFRAPIDDLGVDVAALPSALTAVPAATGYNHETLKIFQYAQLNTDITLFNVADAGVQDPVRPPPPPPGGGRPPMVDPSITNLQQIAAVTINSTTLSGDSRGRLAATFDLQAAFTPGRRGWEPIANQWFDASAERRGDSDITLFNVAHALSWKAGAYTGPGSEWDPFKAAGTGDVRIGGPLPSDDAKTTAVGEGGVKQIVALTINSVTSAPGVDDLKPDHVNVVAGTFIDEFDDPLPGGLTPFYQYANLSDLDLKGRPKGNYDGGAGVLTSFLFDEQQAFNFFPSLGGSTPFPPQPEINPALAQNQAIAGTGMGDATIQNLDQVVAVSVNNFAFDNAQKDADGNVLKDDKGNVLPVSFNTDVVSGAIKQVAVLADGDRRDREPKTFDLANLALATTNKGVATLDTVTQTNVFSVNSFTAGYALFGSLDQNVADAGLDDFNFTRPGLVQRVDTGNAVLNLANYQLARGTTVEVTDTKQVNLVALNTGTIGTTLGGVINQSVNGGVNVNAANYLGAAGTLSASITGAMQTNVVNVNSITGYTYGH